MPQQQIQKITIDTLISEILAKNPGKSAILAEMLLDFGIHCIGCGASSFETLGQGVLGHGFSEQQLNKLIEDLNKVLGEETESSSKHESEITAEIFSLKLTDKAIKKVKEVMKQKNSKKNTATTTLRVSVIPGGCSGYLYDLQIIDKPSKDDLNFKQEGVNVAVDKKSADILHGITIDYVDTLNESGFKFNNPNAGHGCGCGKSFG